MRVNKRWGEFRIIRAQMTARQRRQMIPLQATDLFIYSPQDRLMCSTILKWLNVAPCASHSSKSLSRKAWNSTKAVHLDRRYTTRMTTMRMTPSLITAKKRLRRRRLTSA